MINTTGLPTDWDKSLPAWRDELVREAHAHQGTWQWRELPIGWRYCVLLSEGGQLAYRFRSPQYQGLTWDGFHAESRRLLQVLGASHWRATKNERRLFWEVTYTAPARESASPRSTS